MVRVKSLSLCGGMICGLSTDLGKKKSLVYIDCVNKAFASSYIIYDYGFVKMLERRTRRPGGLVPVGQLVLVCRLVVHGLLG